MLNGYYYFYSSILQFFHSSKKESFVGNAKIDAWLVVAGILQTAQRVVGLDDNLRDGEIVDTADDIRTLGIVVRGLGLCMLGQIGIVLFKATEDIQFLVVAPQTLYLREYLKIVKEPVFALSTRYFMQKYLFVIIAQVGKYA